MLTTYKDFLTYVEDKGFLPLSPLVPGLPSLGVETPKELWHTGLETDPWRWKDRAAEEKKLAYGCIMGGHKGFVTRRMYPIFVAAYRHTLPMPERYENGTVNQRMWQLWQLFEEAGEPLTISTIRKNLGVTKKNGASAVDTSIRNLQAEYYITIDGSERKRNKQGEPYGWPVNRYARVTDWAPEGWLDTVKDYSADEAREIILDAGMAMGTGVNRQVLKKKLGM